MIKKLFWTCMLLVGTVSLAQAQAVGLLNCGGGGSLGSGSKNGIELSYIHMGATDDGLAQSGDTKVKLLPLVVHASLVNFDSLLQLGMSGAVSNACVLGVNLPDGTLLTFQLSTLSVKRVTANANSATTEHGPYAYTQVTFTYSAATPIGGQGGSDDGGLGPTGGWDIGQGSTS